MKKFFFSAVAAIAIMFSSCSNDEVTNPEGSVGSIRFAVDFEDATTAATRAAASSTAIPITSWNNVDKIRMFLYNATDGTIAYSYEIDPAAKADKVFNFLDIPSGTYNLALVANIKSSTNNVATSVDNWATLTELGDYTVRTKKINTDVVMDLKKLSAFPTGHAIPAARVPYASASEVFVAYQSGITITTGGTNDLTATPLLLKREVSLMRVRINKKADFLNEPGKLVDFANATNLIAVQTIPVGFGLKLGSFAGGINATPSDANRVIVGANGASTFRTANPLPATHTNPVVLDNDFTLWQEVLVLPNATKAEGKLPSADANQARKFTIIVSAQAPAGYKLDNGTTLATSKPIYWSGIVNEVFLENNIREVNLTIKSRGTDVWPEIKEVGGLDIKVSAPENWNTTIQKTDKEV